MGHSPEVGRRRGGWVTVRGGGGRSLAVGSCSGAREEERRAVWSAAR
jgi:hypothetical protein